MLYKHTAVAGDSTLVELSETRKQPLTVCHKALVLPLNGLEAPHPAKVSGMPGELHQGV